MFYGRPFAPIMVGQCTDGPERSQRCVVTQGSSCVQLKPIAAVVLFFEVALRGRASCCQCRRWQTRGIELFSLACAADWEVLPAGGGSVSKNNAPLEPKAAGRPLLDGPLLRERSSHVE